MINRNGLSKNILLYLLLIPLLSFPAFSQGTSTGDFYTFRAGDPNGIGKWYMGREIAYVMGWQGINWLERPTREKEERTATLLDNLNIQPTDIIADIGAGSGYHIFQMAPFAQKGLVYAVDIQDEMLATIRNRININGVKNVIPIKGSDKSVNLPGNKIDKVLLVDVYHEFSYPAEMMESIKKSLKEDGKVYLIEYRGEDDWVPIKKVHKMTEKQAVKEMKAAGFRLEKNIDNLPWQHCMIFVKK